MPSRLPMGRALLATILFLSPPSDSPIDAHFEARFKKLRLKPAKASDDAVFLRRLSLDVTGRLPEPKEIRAFLRSRDRSKRQKKIEEKLSSPAAADYFAHLWVQWLMGHQIDTGDLQRLEFGALTRWLRKAWEEDLPYDGMVRSFLTATGNLRETPAANFQAKYLASGDPPAELAAATARLFAGREIQCAQCHDHPYGRMTQESFWQFASFFRPLSYRQGTLTEGSPSKPASLREDLGELYQEPRFLDGATSTEGSNPFSSAIILHTNPRSPYGERGWARVDAIPSSFRLTTLYLRIVSAVSSGQTSRRELAEWPDRLFGVFG